MIIASIFNCDEPLVDDRLGWMEAFDNQST
jgi:hypothetical protein